MPDSGFLNYMYLVEYFSVARHNPHIKAFFVYLLMQELFVSKIHFFKFLSKSEKPQLHQLKIFSTTRSTEQGSLNLFIRMEKHHQGRRNSLR